MLRVEYAKYLLEKRLNLSHATLSNKKVWVGSAFLRITLNDLFLTICYSLRWVNDDENKLDHVILYSLICFHIIYNGNDMYD